MKKADTEQGFAAQAVSEAITALQLVKREALGDLLAVLPSMDTDPRAAVATMIEAGTPLNATEKAALGLHARTFMSREMFAQLTPKGLLMPMQAHATTLYRAWFSISRRRNLLQTKAFGMLFLGQRICPQTTNCPQSEVWMNLDELDPLPPSDCRDCDYMTCRSTFVFRRAGRDNRSTFA